MERERSGKRGRQAWWGLLFAAALVGALFALYPPLGTSSAGEIHGDAVRYLAMADGATEEAPFAWRIGVPRLVATLPFSHATGFAFLTAVGLVLAIVVVWMIGARLAFSPEARVWGIGLASTSVGFAHHFHNPFLTDGAALGVNALVLGSWVAGWPLAALGLVLVGTAVRETTMLGGLLFLGDRRWRWALTLVTVGAVSWLVIRALPGMPEAPSTMETVRHVLTAKGPVKIVGDAVGTWHVFWLLAVLGALRAEGDRRRVIGTSLVVFVGSGLALSLVAINTSRMLAFAWPAFALGLAAFFESSQGRSRRWCWGLAAWSVCSLLVWFPNRLTGAALVAPAARALVGIVALVLVLALVRQKDRYHHHS